MSFFEDIAAALDVDGIESRVHDDTMFVPITPELEIQFVEIDPILPAANVYIAAADVDEDDDDFEAVLVSVVFSVDLRDLLEGTDERISDLEFFQDLNDANLVRAEVGQNSELHVVVESAGGTPTATVMFVALGESYDELVNQAMAEMWTPDSDEQPSEEERLRVLSELSSDISLVTDEVLDLGTFTDFDRLFDVLSLAADQAENWEEQLLPIDEEMNYS